MPVPAPTLTCRHCQAPLAPPQRAAGHCGAAGCRYREQRARWARLTKELGEPALQSAAAKLPVAAKPTLLWLRDTQDRLVPLPKARRAAHLAHLQALVSKAPAELPPPLAEPAPDTARGPQEGRLCGQCRGRCCAQGAPTHAFITLPQLLRWQQREPGRTLQDAVDEYLARLPARHTKGGCVYQGPGGCVLPRADRADICNSYACDSLKELQQTLEHDREAAFVAVTLAGDALLRRGLITAQRTRRL